MLRHGLALTCSFQLFLAIASSTALAESPPPKPFEVGRALYLIHPFIYENLEKNNPDLIREGNYQIYRDREKLCEQRWIEAIDQLGPDAIFVQLYGGQATLDHARQKLGDRRVIAPGAAWSKELSPREYHDRLAASFRQQLEKKNLAMDLETVTWELAGESFEGCVFTYGSGMASSLGLKRAPVIRFDLCVPDARFLCSAELVEAFPLEGSDVNAYVFDSADGYPVGIFLPGFRDTKARYVDVHLDEVSRLEVVNKCGITLFSRKGGRGAPGPDRDHEGISVIEGGLRITLGPSWYLMGRLLSKEKFLAMMRGAGVVSED